MSRDRKTIAPQIIDEASEWFVTMREPSASAVDREAFAEWLRASPVHVGAYLEIARLWTDASHIERDQQIDLNGDQSPKVVQLREGRESGERSQGSTTGSSSRSRARPLAIAASFLITLVAGSIWLYVDRAPTYTTDVGEQRTITLEDGSIVKLNSRSECKVRMSPKLRQIELIDGQALFQVAHDANRPFIVTTGNSAIRAVGTQFDVNRKHTGTIVTVIEGRVRLDRAAPSGLTRFFGVASIPAVQPKSTSLESESQQRPRPVTPGTPNAGTVTEGGSAPTDGEVYVSAGEQMRVAASGAMERTAKPNTAAAISWLQQELIFEDQPLTDVVEEFNRYTRTPIVLADPALANLRINAVFHTTNPDSLLRFISRDGNVRIDRSEKEVRISKR